MNKLINTFKGTKVPETTIKNINGCLYMEVHYVISEQNGEYTWTNILLKKSEHTYPVLVDAIIGLSYSLRETLAIIGNYLSNPKNPEYKQEFEEFQKVRKAAKDYAKKYFNI